MDKQTHKEAADIYFKYAEESDKQFQKGTKKKANMVVAAQNYFYATINLIEYVFARTDEHSFNHENRYRKIAEKSSLFSSELKELFNEVDRDLRNKVAYRGFNGEKYGKIKELCKLARSELSE